MLNPAGLGFAVIIPLIILLYLLKRRFQEKMISSTYLWDEVLKDIEATTPWQRLKKNLLLFLQLLAALLLVLALCRPYLLLPGAMEKQMLVLLDASASMRASDVLPSRWGMAQKEVEKLIERMGPGEKMTLIKMGEEPEVLQAASGDKSELRRALREAQPESGQADLEAALSLIASLGRDSREAMLFIVSDGKTRPVEHDPGIKFPVEFIQLGRESDNLAIITLATRRDAEQVLALARVQNFGDKAVASDIELRVDGELFDLREIKLDAGGEREIIWEDLPPDAGNIQAILQRPDYLLADNEAWAVVEELSEKRALLVTDSNIFLERALNLYPGLQLFKTSTRDYDPAFDDYQLFIFDGWLPARLPPASILILNPPAGNPHLTIEGEAKNLRDIKSSGEDPLLRYIDSSEWQVARSQKVIIPDWARTLLESQGIPLLLAGKLSGRVVILPFDLHESNIPLQSGFPILIHNLLSWLLPGHAGVSFDISPNRFHFEPHPEAEALYFSGPEGKEQRYLPPFPSYFSSDRPGLYQLKQLLPDRVESIFLAKNQGDPLESDIKPAALPWQALKADSGGGAERLGKRELWPWLCWAVLLLLLLEWEVYRRGY